MCQFMSWKMKSGNPLTFPLMFVFSHSFCFSDVSQHLSGITVLSHYKRCTYLVTKKLVAKIILADNVFCSNFFGFLKEIVHLP